jgi:hypothetical protein
MGSLYHLYDHLSELLAQHAPETLYALKADAVTQARFNKLVGKKTKGSITPAESEELEHFIALEHLVRLAKIKAELKLENS